MNNRLALAMGAYVALALAAWSSLQGVIRIAVWVFLAGLAVKTWIASRMRG